VDGTFDAHERDAILRIDFLAFAMRAFLELFPGPYSPERLHEMLALVLASTVGKRTRLIINAPPRSLKSFLISIAWVAFRLGHEPTHKFLCASYSQPLANQLSSDCRRLMESEWYCNLFPTRLAKTTEDELVTVQGGYRYARSVGGTLTGMGGDTLIVDDPISATDAGSATSRQTVNTWFTRTLMSRLNDKSAGVIIVVMQRLHLDDLTGHLVAKGGWEHLVFPAITLRDTTVTLPNRSLVWSEGEALQHRETLSVLSDLKQQLGLATFNANYQQQPDPEDGNDLKRDWLKWYDVPPEPQPGDQIVLSCDTAMKATATSNYSALLTFRVRNGNQFYLIDVQRGRFEFPELCTLVKEQARSFKSQAILVEGHALGVPLIADLKRSGLNGVIEIRPTTDKRSRMRGETPKLEAGSLILPKAAPWLDEFLQEYLTFPSGKYDDQIDALSQFLTWITGWSSRTVFEADFGTSGSQSFDRTGARLAAPDPTEILGYWR
jgi:predicted phage terminase large subunit-like protein